MFFYEGYFCPICNKPFCETDDIVTCPVCGAPHHRECWKAEGHCHFEDTHGTDKQWSRETATTPKQNADIKTGTCPHCGHENSVFAEYCSSCGRELHAEEWQSNQPQTPPPPPYGTVYGEYRPFQAAEVFTHDNEDFDGVTGRQLRIFTGRNTGYYLPRFLKFKNEGSSVSWNWAAFLLTPYWLWYRKQYLAGSLVLFFELLYAAVNAFFTYVYVGISNISTLDGLLNAAQNIPQNETTMRWVMIIYLLMFIKLLISLTFGMLGNWIYYHTAKRRISKLHDSHSVEALIKSGSVSMVLATIAYCILYFAGTFFGLIFM